MIAYAETFSLQTHGKGTTEITREVADIISRSGVRCGTVTVFVQHTSASLVIMENADPSARRDLEVFFDKLVPENTPWFIHTQEGPDDMPSHIRMALWARGRAFFSSNTGDSLTTAKSPSASSVNELNFPKHRS